MLNVLPMPCDFALAGGYRHGFGALFNIARTIRAMEKNRRSWQFTWRNQVAQKRCGHRPNKTIISQQRWSINWKRQPMPEPTKALWLWLVRMRVAVEGIDSAIEQAIACVRRVQDAIFPEAMNQLDYTWSSQAAALKSATGKHVPILATSLSLADTPLYNCNELAPIGVDMVLYPLSAFRPMNKSGENVYKHLLVEGNQKLCWIQCKPVKSFTSTLSTTTWEQAWPTVVFKRRMHEVSNNQNQLNQ